MYERNTEKVLGGDKLLRSLPSALLILVVLMYSGCGEQDQGTPEAGVKEPGPVGFSLKEASVGGPRKMTGLQLTKEGWTYKCMECHAAIEARWHYEREMVEHRHIELKHGTNSFCLNCHHPENRNVYVHYDGSEIAEDSVELLCRKCHGPQYRDWKQGVHGRVNGFWNSDLGPQTRLKCTQCHDPHDPAFKPLSPMPPPTYPQRAAGARTGKQKHNNKGVAPHG